MLLLPIIVIALLLLGEVVLRAFPQLGKLNFPPSLIGGMIGLVLLSHYRSQAGTEIIILDGWRDALLIGFFTCTGLHFSASEARRGGKHFIRLSLLCVLLIVGQNSLGQVVAHLTDIPSWYGVFGGSISFVGGFGSSLAWGAEMKMRGVPEALEVGLICSMFGLVAGAVLAGPLAAFLANRSSNKNYLHYSPPVLKTDNERSLTFIDLAITLLCIGISVAIGDLIRAQIATLGHTCPRFLTAMIVAAGIASLSELLPSLKISREMHDIVGSLALQLFIVIALLTLDTASLLKVSPAILAICISQIIFTTLFCALVVYRLFGRSFDGAVVASGVFGIGVSSFAVAVATMKEMTKPRSASPAAFQLVVIVGSVVLDIANSIIIAMFLNR